MFGLRFGYVHRPMLSRPRFHLFRPHFRSEITPHGFSTLLSVKPASNVMDEHGMTSLSALLLGDEHLYITLTL